MAETDLAAAEGSTQDYDGVVHAIDGVLGAMATEHNQGEESHFLGMINQTDVMQDTGNSRTPGLLDHNTSDTKPVAREMKIARLLSDKDGLGLEKSYKDRKTDYQQAHRMMAGHGEKGGGSALATDNKTGHVSRFMDKEKIIKQGGADMNGAKALIDNRDTAKYESEHLRESSIIARASHNMASGVQALSSVQDITVKTAFMSATAQHQLLKTVMDENKIAEELPQHDVAPPAMAAPAAMAMA